MSENITSQSEAEATVAKLALLEATVGSHISQKIQSRSITSLSVEAVGAQVLQQ